jgi:Zn-dependent M28 family amino/carboxypeptidase
MGNILVLLLSSLLVACNAPKTAQNTDKAEKAPQPIISIERNLQAHVNFLADDAMKGRNTGSNEYEIAARYVASHFKQFGLKPAGNDNNWFQPVPFRQSKIDQTSIGLTIQTKDGELAFEYPTQFMIGPNSNTDSDNVTAPLVFVGYGIDAPSLNHNDYDGLDVKGKIVVVLAGKPQSFPSELGAHVATRRERARYAAEHGAIGLMTVHTPLMDKVRTYEKFLSYVGRPVFRWTKADGTAAGTQPNLKVGAYLSKEAGKAIFKAAGADLDKIFNDMAEKKIPKGFALDATATVQRKSSHETTYSSNVVGIIEGSDPQLSKEFVVYMAHLDHIGIGGKVKEGDDINNGALDNASGIAIMLETARKFSMQAKPKRSILFVAVTAEEQGLLGSDYFANNPTVDINAMVAAINLDMPLILYPFADVIAFGAEHSTMKAYVAKAAASQDLKLTPDPMPEQNLFTRSDHYSFVKQGVPSIFLVPGMQSKDPKINGGALLADFLKNHYHQPTDDLNLPINYQAGATFTNVNYQIGSEIANSKEKPQWNEGDFFGDTFGNKEQ